MSENIQKLTIIMMTQWLLFYNNDNDFWTIINNQDYCTALIEIEPL